MKIPFNKHGAYQKLTALLKARSGTAGALKLIEISGVPYSLQLSLVTELGKDYNQLLIYASRDSQEIRKYFDSLQFFHLSKLSFTELQRVLVNYNFERTVKVAVVGEFSIQGDTVTFWPAGYDNPLKAVYFDNELEQAVIYDSVYGRSLLDVNGFVTGDFKELETEAAQSFINIVNLTESSAGCALIFGGDSLDDFDSHEDIRFDFAYPHLYFNRFDLLEKELPQLQEQEYVIEIETSHDDILPPKLKKFVVGNTTDLESGFRSKELKLLYLTDRELFGSVFLSKTAGKLTTKQARKLLAQLEGEIEIGDYVVHEDHGIGRYMGLKQEKYIQKIPLGFNEFRKKEIYEDYLFIEYAEGDQLLVPLSQLDRITKYIGSEENEPKITRLGKQEWSKLVKKVRASIAIMAKELVEHYAKRELAKSPVIGSEISDGLQEFIDNFPYQETEDQLRTQREVFADLAKDTPMNRLIVGDVGFGKTEIAMRAAYKAAEDGYQVAVLVPTTVLAAQHGKVFRDRFKDSGFELGELSRLSGKSNKQTVADIKTGKVKIAIGTHRLLGNDIEFKKLGLIIIDEEQKFGVKQKEKLKRIEYGVHVLAMSATPIPRTLSMALSNIQDISIIQTPPEGRRQVETKVTKMDKAKVVAAITYELDRNGQVYYLHNRVTSIVSKQAELQRLLPSVRFKIAHGQLPPEKLASTMDDFYNHEFDVLICTTIIENGLDMPNVNTIVIEKGQNYGLGQLYQLRGRVGRGEKQAYAYIFYDGDVLDKTEAQEAEEVADPKLIAKRRQRQKYRERLKAIAELQELGSGFSLASRDLEIRGAGNLLGREQHGNINTIGYGMYMQMLAEEIERLKQLKKDN